MKTDWQFLVVVYIFGVFLVVVIDSYAISMTKDIVVGDELPDWVGAKEFYQKYDPKEVIGRWVQQKKKIWNVISVFFWDDKKNQYCILYKWYLRGVSSVVRRCVHRHTGQELAVKIIEITAEKMTAKQLEEVKTSTLKEIQVLNMVKGHASISMLDFSFFWTARRFNFLFLEIQKCWNRVMFCSL